MRYNLYGEMVLDSINKAFVITEGQRDSKRDHKKGEVELLDYFTVYMVYGIEEADRMYKQGLCK